MKLSPIILALRLANTTFESRIGGLADFARIETNTLKYEAAFIIPFDEEGREDENDAAANQKVKERFSVVCAIKNDNNLNEKVGLTAYDRIDDIRDELFKILINFDLGYDSTISYDRGRILNFNAAWLWYQWDFIIYTRISSDETGYGFVELRDVDNRMQPSQLPDLYRIYADYILAPSAKLPYIGKLPADSYIDVDASQMTDSDDNPNLGAFGSGYAKAYNKLISS